jgi:nucleoside phosphorylase
MTRVDIAVLTAKPEEFGAFFRRLEQPAKWRGTKRSPNQYGWTIGTLSTSTGKLKIALGLTHEQTNAPAAIAALATFSRFKPRYIVFIGIAGSLHKDVRRGDVLIADYVRAYQYGRLSETGAFKPRPQFQEPTDQALRTNAAAFAETTQWWGEERKKPDDTTGHPRVHFGGVAAGEAVVESVDSGYLAPVLDSDPWLRAVEMESAGLALAVRYLKESGYVTGLMVVRGISDMPIGVAEEGGPRRQEGANREMRKEWTEYASNVAAQFLEHFIKQAFPYSPSVPAKASPQRANKPLKKQLDAGALASFQSHFVRANELRIIHYINDETFKPSVLVPKATLETWWRANPLTIRLVSTIGGEAVGYWHILPLSSPAYRGLIGNRLTERQIATADILTYQTLRSGSVYIYITAVSALRSMQTGSAAVILDLIAFLQLLHKTIGIDRIAAQAVSDDPLNLIASFGMRKVASAKAISTWTLDSRSQVDGAMQSGQRQLIRLKGLIPETPREERRSLVELLRR